MIKKRKLLPHGLHSNPLEKQTGLQTNYFVLQSFSGFHNSSSCRTAGGPYESPYSAALTAAGRSDRWSGFPARNLRVSDAPRPHAILFTPLSAEVYGGRYR